MGTNLIGGIIFGAIGFVAFTYGKKMGSWKPMAIGALLLVFPYFVADTKMLYIIGGGLTAALYFFRD
jgi:hypothetical protein